MNILIVNSLRIFVRSLGRNAVVFDYVTWPACTLDIQEPYATTQSQPGHPYILAAPHKQSANLSVHESVMSARSIAANNNRSKGTSFRDQSDDSADGHPGAGDHMFQFDNRAMSTIRYVTPTPVLDLLRCFGD